MTQGGAINLDQGATVTIAGSTFTDNTAATSGLTGVGGAIAASGLKQSSIVGSVFAGNSAGGRVGQATGMGGAIEVSGDLTIGHSLFTGNTAIAGPIGFGTGGAIAYEGSFGFPPAAITLTGDVLVGNTASGGIIGNGGGLANLFGGIATIRETTIVGNTASGVAGQGGQAGNGQGGGVFDLDSTLTLTGDLIAFNAAVGGDGAIGGDGQGGGVYTSSNTSNPVTITDTTIVANAALAGQGQAGGNGQGVGGGLYIDAGPVALKGRTMVVFNHADTADSNIHGTHT